MLDNFSFWKHILRNSYYKYRRHNEKYDTFYIKIQYIKQGVTPSSIDQLYLLLTSTPSSNALDDPL